LPARFSLCKERIEEWLCDIGLELKPSKTRISHTLNTVEIENSGFNFLGFHIQQFLIGKYASGRTRKGLLGFKTIITPSIEGQKRHYRKMVEVIKKLQGVSQATLISKLNPIIRGWCNYYSHVVSNGIFARLWHLLVYSLNRSL
jgi:RNA-directed DNA polymerase